MFFLKRLYDGWIGNFNWLVYVLVIGNFDWLFLLFLCKKDRLGEGRSFSGGILFVFVVKIKIFFRVMIVFFFVKIYRKINYFIFF